MNIFKDAETFMKSREQTTQTPDELSREALITELRKRYENATMMEIERALDKTLESTDTPWQKSDILKKIRTKLED